MEFYILLGIIICNGWNALSATRWVAGIEQNISSKQMNFNIIFYSSSIKKLKIYELT